MSSTGQDREATVDLDAVASGAAMLRARLERMQAGDRKTPRRPSLAPAAAIPDVSTLPEPRRAAAEPPSRTVAAPAPAETPPARQAGTVTAPPRPPAQPGPHRPARASSASRSNPPPAGPEQPTHGAQPTAATGRASPLPPPALSAPSPTTIQAPDLHGGGELRAALVASKRALKAVGWYSCAVNVLMLTGPIFMLQVYDRVMSSGSYSTLLVLFTITVVLYVFIGALEYGRSRLITRIGVEIDQRIGDRVFAASVRRSLGGPGQATGALRELDTLRSFVSGPAPMTVFDLAWTPIYLLVIFLTHWTLGIASVVGMAALLFCAWLSEAQGRAPLAEAGKAAAKAIDIAETGSRNADSITAMGMLSAYRARWQKRNQEALAWQVLASDRLGGTAAVSKTLRLLMQSLMLAVGAALAMHGDISAGAIIAGTIIFGRALAPVEQVITHWRSSAKALESYKKLVTLLAETPAPRAQTSLPRPSGQVRVEALRVAAPESRTLILNGVSCTIEPGKMLAVIGPSASGKSTFVRALVGLWPAVAGSIQFDGVKLEQWHDEDLGRHIGYLPQDVELFGGTVRDNIARFRDDVPDAAVVAAAKAAHAHELIMGLPKGYETELGAFGAYLSAGQRQRIGLARALFGDPALVVLDEPNANLDRAGDEALAAAIDGMRSRGQAIVLVSHRVQAIGMADMLLFLEKGVQRAFGPREEVLRAMGASTGASPNAPSTPQSAPPRAASERRG